MLITKPLKIIIASSTLTCLVILPATAGLGNVWSDFQSYSNDLKNYITNNLSELKPYEVQTQSAINNSSSPLTIGKSVREQITQYSQSDKFDNNPAVNGAMVSNQIGRQMTLSTVEGTLGRNGQTRIKNKLQNTEQVVNNIASMANAADTNKKRKQIEIEAVVSSANALNNIPSIAASGNPLSLFGSVLNNQAKLTQLTWEGLADLELQNINIQKEQSKIGAETLATTTQIHHDLQYTNLNLVNISQQLDETNRSQRVNTSAEVARLLQVTSQTDLIGRKN
ncbi:hypothetical protein DSM106972_089490 [Dulcicalothrix desertica PCC 7102]|uniref:Uncharacterized protein n=1 Tax=Dulcicalothrix desertica PCC 7102 TaxID=232991 RepID=A0A433UP17_9CYAN|nr:hypothetical protein [Dulcicalothrix desertica]RUS95593.1 hypothetical protein DSM106972_089490 [Dulcicalothrix desertica PCC 7102]TWH39928.1 hypothetical protein CAL7102_09208 [Dulcicalothrix desertica PCC 7102]